jgi:hypothetical protein
VFIAGTSTKQREFPKIAGRNTKANVFQKGRASFKAIIIIIILYYLCAESTATRPVTDTAQCRYTNNNNNNNNAIIHNNNNTIIMS